VQLEEQKPSTEQSQPDAGHLVSYSLAELLVGTTLVAVLAGLFAYSPGWGILAAIIVAPVSLRTFLVLRARAKLGRATNRQQRIGLFFASLAVASAMCASLSILLIVSLFALLGTVCNSDSAGGLIWLAFFLGTLVFAGFCVFGFFPKWIRSRWRRDLGLPKKTKKKDLTKL